MELVIPWWKQEKISTSKIFSKVFSSKETLAITTLSCLEPGNVVNLERALQINDRLSGHFVYGHIDCKVKISRMVSNEDSMIFSFRFAKSLQKKAMRYLIHKGSISLNGVSLTIYQKKNAEFLVMLIPHTVDGTTFSTSRVGDEVNVEFDALSKYLENFIPSNN